MSDPLRPRVFGIGLNKTGTSSLTAALDALGYRTLHFAGPERSSLIRGAISVGAPMLSELDQGFDAFADVTPVTEHFYLADVQYPGSKFILTVRDLDQWLDSRRRHVEKNRRKAAAGTYRGTFLEVDPVRWAAECRLHEGTVRSYFYGRPSDLLMLDITAGEGWHPLCDFLAKPTPSVEFPWVNRDQPGRDRSESRSRVVEGSCIGAEGAA